MNQEKKLQIILRKATEADLPEIWEIFHEIILAGDTYTLPSDYPYEKIKEYWMGPEIEGREKHYLTRVATIDGKIAGAYAIRPCYSIGGPSAHIANGSYVVHKDFRGQGIARKMGVESLEQAKELGYKKIQFIQVVSTNTAALKLWHDLGLIIVGKSPSAFIHKDGREADLLIMNREL